MNLTPMIGRRWLAVLVLAWLARFSVAPAAFGQSGTELHHFSALGTSAEGDVLMRLAGTPSVPLQKLFDLFPIDVSTNLIHWQPLATLVRTNATHEVAFVDRGMATGPARYYRTPTNHFSTPFDRPTGPHPVGTFSRVLTDATRSNRFGLRGSSNFVATFWYPAVRLAGAVPAAYMERPLAAHRGYWGSRTNLVPSLVQLAMLEAPLAESPADFPIVIYTHGLGIELGRAVRTENTEKLQELASHGYVVLAVDHTDAYGLVLPPERLVIGTNAGNFSFLDDRLKDIRFLLDLLARLDVEDPVLGGRLDLDRIGIMGWSFGGGTSAEACRLQDRLKAAVLLDGYLGSTPTVLSKGLGKPFLAMCSPESGLIGDNSTLFNKASKSAYVLSIKSASHDAFTDNAWIVNPSAQSRRRAQAMNACLVAFFDKHLKGEDNGLLENPAVVWTDVTGFRKK